jgi:hypothetical protein
MDLSGFLAPNSLPFKQVINLINEPHTYHCLQLIFTASVLVRSTKMALVDYLISQLNCDFLDAIIHSYTQL